MARTELLKLLRLHRPVQFVESLRNTCQITPQAAQCGDDDLGALLSLPRNFHPEPPSQVARFETGGLVFGVEVG